MSHITVTRLAILLCALSLTTGLGACKKRQNETTPADAAKSLTTKDGLAKPRNDVPGLRNLARVDKGLWRSYQPRRAGFRQLKRLGVKTVVSLRMTRSDRKYLKGLGLQYKRIPLRPWNAKEDRLVQILRILTDPKNQPALVHCKHGADRTGLVVALYRVIVQGWTKDKALRELKRFGFHSVWKNLKTTFGAIDVAAFRKKLKSTPAPTLDRVK